ncbi:MAG TPA: FtsQ-type POTRA domain-containing protein [Nitrospinota bacterium]|nr:FtsQ-type POTRA domain-containing protein [Nitrospinota bacterium]
MKYKKSKKSSSAEKRFLKIKKIYYRLRIFCIPILIAFFVFQLITYIKQSYFFNVKEINILGTNFLSEKYIAELISVEPGMNIFKIDIEKISKVLGKEPWIKKVKIERKLPKTININIQERKPYAVLLSTEKYLLDDAGFIIKKLDFKEETERYPLIKGVKKINYNIGNRVSLERPLRGLAILKNLSNSGLYNLRDIFIVDMSDMRRVSIKMTNGTRLNLDESNIEKEVSRLKTISKLLKKDKRRIEYVDLCFRKKVVVKLF